MKSTIKFSIILSIFLALSFAGKSIELPSNLSVALSSGTGNWNSPSTWTWLVNNGNLQGPLSYPNDSTFVIIQTGHTVTLSSNATCESLVIEEGATLSNSTYELVIQFMGWAHPINDVGYDDGITYFGYAPIDSTWYVNNPNNANWNIYKVDGVHTGSGNIIFDWDDGIDKSEFGATVSGTGSITSTGSLYYRSSGGVSQGLKFNSACNLQFYANLNLTDDEYPTSGGGALTAYNFGTIHMVGNSDFVTGASGGTFNNKPGASIFLEDGSLYLGPMTALVVLFFNEGILHIQNGNLNIPVDSFMFNSQETTVNGNILGIDGSNLNCFFMQYASGAILSITGEIFPSTNVGTLTCTGYSEGPNYVIYNGNTLQHIITPTEPYLPQDVNAYSVLKVDNIAGTTLNSDVPVQDSLILSKGLINIENYNITLGDTAVIGGTPADTAMVVATGTGEFRKTFTSPGTFLFPVGDNDGTAEYSPVSVEFTTGTFTDGVVGVKLVNAVYPGVRGSQAINTLGRSVASSTFNRFWSISSTGIENFESTAQFYYVPADVIGFESSIWCYRLAPDTLLFSPADTIQHVLTASGLTSFGTFTGLEHVETSLPLVFSVTGGGSYCSGEEGLPVGLSDSEPSVTYTLFKDGLPQEPTVAGTGEAISFGNQTAGTYTVDGTNTVGTVTMTGSAIIIENPLPVVTWTAFEPDTLCIQWSPVLLTGGTPEGGYYSGNGVTGSSFDPAAAGAGVHEITYHYTDDNGCSNEASLSLFVDLCTGVKQQTTLLTLYPNPATETVTLNFNGYHSVRNVKLYNQMGSVVYQNDGAEAQSSSMIIPVDNYPAGQYLLVVTCPTETLVRKLFIAK